MSTIKPVLIIGGPADGQRIIFDVSARIYRAVQPLGGETISMQTVGDSVETQIPLNATEVAYAIGTVQGAFHGVFYVGVQNLSDCVICALLAGYRKARRHDTDLNVAEQLVTLLGGAADGRQVAVPSNCVFIPAAEMGDAYQIVPLICKDGRIFRVGVLDMLTVDPMHLLYDGYRVELRK